MKKCMYAALTGLLAFAVSSCSSEKEKEEVFTVGFENAPLGENGYQSHVAYSENGVRFNHEYDAEWDAWSGFSVSNHTDTQTQAYTNQYSVAAGTAASGRQFAVVYGYSTESEEQTCFFTFEDGKEHRLKSMSVANSTYAYLSMLNGSDFSKKFESGDYHAMVFTGYDLQGHPTGTQTHYLADFRHGQAKLSDEWETVAFSSIQPFSKMVITFISSDTGYFGINTPTYACIDDLVFQP